MLHTNKGTSHLEDEHSPYYWRL